MPKFLHVVGARPNFMKVAPVYLALRTCPQVHQRLLHTGQHYDFNMSDVFFQQLQIPAPDINLGVGSGTHAHQTAEIMTRFEGVVLQDRPDMVIVYGDVNSTVAAALVSAKLMVPVAHVEAGLRSFDRTMPEEINRLLTDQLAELLFTPSADGNANLEHEGVPPERVHLVGNVMIDTLVRMLPAARDCVLPQAPASFILVTLHRPSNVDDIDWLISMIRALESIGRQIPVLFPVHPRTRQRLSEAGISANQGVMNMLEPLPYLDFLSLQARATAVVTDSGGIQEESTFLGVPCLTMRTNTERPITVQMGTNVLVGRDIDRMCRELCQILRGERKQATIPPLWDGHAGERIADILVRWGDRFDRPQD